jgi:long-chain acyl-CoA synthetase
MGIYDQRPWLELYEQGQPHDLETDSSTMLDVWQEAVRIAPERDAIRYFDRSLTVRELDEQANAFAVALADRGVGRGDRVGVYLQNVPQFVLALLAAWKLGAIAVSINPMNKQRELATLLTDSGAKALVCHDNLHAIVDEVVAGTDVELVITTSEFDYQNRDDPRAFPGGRSERPAGTADVVDLVEENRGRAPGPVSLSPDDTAILTYTSGTTGPPKGAMNSHGNLVFNARTYRHWCHLGGEDPILGVAPLFHITGLVGHIAVALLNPAPLVLTHRFDPGLVADAVAEHRVRFTIGSITVFIALMNSSEVAPEKLSTMDKIFSGGAPIPPSTVRDFQDKFGHYIHNFYGLTETNSPSHGVPFGAGAPVDEQSGALSVGVPVFNTVVWILDEEGREVPPGEVGEIVTAGPQVVSGYWNKPEETATALPNGALHTGDVGYMDADGWFYLVDRKKDQINASGYKVWPREVEDVLYEHPAVREAAVVGVADEYRGESVKAFVSLRAEQRAEPAELVDFCRQRMAAYKYPREVEVLDELPKTVTGKLLRRELRDRQPAS